MRVFVNLRLIQPKASQRTIQAASESDRLELSIEWSETKHRVRITLQFSPSPNLSVNKVPFTQHTAYCTCRADTTSAFSLSRLSRLSRVSLSLSLSLSLTHSVQLPNDQDQNSIWTRYLT